MKVRDEWGTIWTAGRTKTHIMPDCPYVTDRHTPVGVEAFPETHVDLCSWCEKRFERWSENRYNRPESENTPCDRCGTHTDNETYCAECHTRLARKKARR